MWSTERDTQTPLGLRGPLTGINKEKNKFPYKIKCYMKIEL